MRGSHQGLAGHVSSANPWRRMQTRRNLRAWRAHLPLAVERYTPARRQDITTAIQAVLGSAPGLVPPAAPPLYQPALSPATLPEGVPSVYGLCGKPRAGKEMMADYLVAHYAAVARIAFSESILEETNAYLSHYLYGRKRAHRIVEENKSEPHYRHLLQAWGQARREENPQYWTESVRNKITARLADGARLVIATGARAPSEVELIRELGGALVRVVRPGYNYPSDHEAERAIDHLPDSGFTTVFNAVEGNPEAYEANIEAVLRGQPQRYI